MPSSTREFGTSPAAVALPPRRVARPRPWWADVWVRMLRSKPLGTAGGLIVLAMLVAAVLADWIAPYGYAQTSLRERFVAMNAAHWLGTDELGRDLLTRLLYGARISLYVGFGAIAIGSVLATLIGVVSGYLGGRFDLLVQRGVDAWMAFPPLLLLLSIMSLLGPSVWNITLVLGVAFGIQNSRVVRGVALLVKEHTFVESARALGAGHVRMTLTHILPNVMPTIIVVATTGLSTVILTEASLSFLGLGVPPPYPTWGGMLSLAGLDHMYRAPWLAIWPAVALSLAVFGFNMLGDALRDLLDPRLKGG
jgi:peptide/nickel transport system permease protein